MAWKKLGKVLLFPPVAILLLLLPICTGGLVYSMLALEEADPVRITFYVLSFYTLTLWCVRVPGIIRFIREFQKENRYMKRWFSDAHLRTNVILCGNTLWNSGYGALQLALGIYHRAPWFYALAGYYASLAGMRFFLVRYTLRHKPGEKMEQELVRYRTCGWIFLIMNLALSAMMFYMIQQDSMVRHHEITTIAMAAYTFTTLTMGIINVVRYRKYNSPAMSAAKAISLAAACVSILTLENTMLTTFGGTDMTPQTHRMFLGFSGGGISLLIVVMAIYMILQANQKIKILGESYNG